MISKEDIDKIEKIAKEAIPIAEVKIRYGPYIPQPPGAVLGEGDIQIFWNVKVLDHKFEWQTGLVQIVLTKEARSSDNLVHLNMQRVKECYAKFRDKVSHIEGFRKNYRVMMSIIYSDQAKFERFNEQKAY